MESRKSVFLWGNFITLSVNKYHLWFKTTVKKVLKYKLFSIYLSLQDNIIKWRTFRRTNDYAGHLSKIQECPAQIQDFGPKCLNTVFAVAKPPEYFAQLQYLTQTTNLIIRAHRVAYLAKNPFCGRRPSTHSENLGGRAKNWEK